MTWLAETWKGTTVYLWHVLGLIMPGHPVPTYEEPVEAEAALKGWSPADHKLMIEEGRRQYDQQVSDLKHTRDRAQWLFTAALALVTAIAAVGASIFPHPAWYVLLLWLAGLVATTYAALGAAAVLTVRADFQAIHTKPLSEYASPVEEQLARDYAEMLETGEETVNTRLSVYRQAVVWLISGGYLTLLAWLLAQ